MKGHKWIKLHKILLRRAEQGGTHLQSQHSGGGGCQISVSLMPAWSTLTNSRADKIAHPISKNEQT